jgi:hypothetical protein
LKNCVTKKQLHLINLAPEIDLATERLVLEPLTPKHAKVLYDAVCDEQIYRFIPQEPPSSEQTLEAIYSGKTWLCEKVPAARCRLL